MTTTHRNDYSSIVRVLVTGSNGMLGAHVSMSLRVHGHEVIEHRRSIADLSNQLSVEKYFQTVNPEAIVHCAALVGGIQANIDGGPLFYNYNVTLDSHVFTAALKSEIKNLIYIGSSCMYPANQETALKPDSILSGPLESTNYFYALSKIAGTNFVSTIADQLGYSWRTFVASNLYGPMDHFGTDRAHLVSAVISKAIRVRIEGANEIEMWGDGSPRREFTYTPEFASWVVQQLVNLDRLPLVMNVGYGIDYPVIEFYEIVLNELGLDIPIKANLQKPSGNMRKLMDSSVAKSFGWDPKVDIRTGIRQTIEWYAEQLEIKL